MTHPNDQEVHQRVVRLLDLMGQMIQEVGGLMGAGPAARLGPASAPADVPSAADLTDAAETASAPEETAPQRPSQPEPRPESPPEPRPQPESPPEPRPQPVVESSSGPGVAADQIAETLDAEFAALFGEEAAAEPAATGQGRPVTEKPAAQDLGEVTEEPAAQDAGEVTEEPEVQDAGEVTTEPAAQDAGEVTEEPAVQDAREAAEGPEVRGAAELPEDPEVGERAGLGDEPDGGERPIAFAPGSPSPPAGDLGRLYLVCFDEHDRRMAIPWEWIADTRLSESCAPEAFILNDGETVRRIKVRRLRGVWSAKELQDWTEDVYWVTSLRHLPSPAAPWSEDSPTETPSRPAPPDWLPDPGAAARPEPEADESPEPPGAERSLESNSLEEVTTESGAGRETPPAVTASADPTDPTPHESEPEPGPEPPEPGPEPPEPRPEPPAPPSESEAEPTPESRPLRSSPPADPAGDAASWPMVWVVSPSALARRFLMRHLDEVGIEVHEARDLDDPLLPADLEGAGALFLDESLRDHWSTHPAANATHVPLVLLTVEGTLRVPAEGVSAAEGAALPRPFERNEVESVVAWLRSLWQDETVGGSFTHADAQNDTWLFADPFGNRNTGNGPGR